MFPYLQVTLRHPRFVAVFVTESQFWTLLLRPLCGKTLIKFCSDLTKFSMNVKLKNCQLNVKKMSIATLGRLASILKLLMKISQQSKIRLKFGYVDSIYHVPELISLTSFLFMVRYEVICSFAKICIPQNFVMISSETSI